MLIYHVNEAGEPQLCDKTLEACPFGDAAAHFLSEAEAIKAFELNQKEMLSEEYNQHVLAITASELNIIDDKLLEQAIKLSQAIDGAERETIETETTPIAIIRAVRIEERITALTSSTSLIATDYIILDED